MLSLLPIVSKGLAFTWMNKRHGDEFVMEKLDRTFANLEWLEKFPQTMVRNLLIIGSDHGPIVLDTEFPYLFTKDLSNLNGYGHLIQTVHRSSRQAGQRSTLALISTFCGKN